MGRSEPQFRLARAAIPLSKLRNSRRKVQCICTFATAALSAYSFYWFKEGDVLASRSPNGRITPAAKTALYVGSIGWFASAGCVSCVNLRCRAGGKLIKLQALLSFACVLFVPFLRSGLLLQILGPCCLLSWIPQAAALGTLWRRRWRRGHEPSLRRGLGRYEVL
jgi:hypothetical protein